jgi:outer membrane protein, adhesin transport system
LAIVTSRAGFTVAMNAGSPAGANTAYEVLTVYLSLFTVQANDEKGSDAGSAARNHVAGSWPDHRTTIPSRLGFPVQRARVLNPTYKKVACAAAAVSLSLGSTMAQAQAWSFPQVAKEALATHPAILGKQSASTAAQADLEGASWQRYPTPTLEAGTDYRGVRTSLFRIQQPIWAGGRITGGIDAAKSRFQASEKAVNEAQQDVVLRVIAAFVEALRQQGREEIVAAGVKQHEQLLGLITRRVEHEASPRVDQELAQSRLYQANNDLSSVRQALANALTQLSQLTGKTITEVGALDVDSIVGAKTKAEAIDQAIAWSATLRRLSYEEAAAQADVEVKKAAYKPQFSVRYENGYASAPLNGVPGYSTSRVLLVAEAQTGAGLSALSGVQAAIARQDAARQQRETALRDVQERVSMDWDEWVAAQTRLENALSASRSSKEVYESYTRQYTAGRKTWLDVLNTVRESTQSDVAATDARAQLTGAALRLKLLTGNLTGIIE